MPTQPQIGTFEYPNSSRTSSPSIMQSPFRSGYEHWHMVPFVDVVVVLVMLQVNDIPVNCDFIELSKLYFEKLK